MEAVNNHCSDRRIDAKKKSLPLFLGSKVHKALTSLLLFIRLSFLGLRDDNTKKSKFHEDSFLGGGNLVLREFRCWILVERRDDSPLGSL